MNKVKSTTVCAVLKDGKIAIGADGQATMGNTVAKSNVNKIRVLHEGKIVKSGTKDLAHELEEKGYDWIK